MSDPAQDVKPSPEEIGEALAKKHTPTPNYNRRELAARIAAEIRAAQQEARKQAFEEAARWHEEQARANQGYAEQHRSDPDIAARWDEEDEDDEGGICDIDSHSVAAAYVDAFTNKALAHEVSARHFRSRAAPQPEPRKEG